MLLLQGAPVANSYAQVLMASLADQLFSIVLLVGFVMYQLRKNASLEKKLEKYQDEDRKEMMRVIQNNTDAMHQVNLFLNTKKILAPMLGFVLFFFSSCRVSKVYTNTTSDSITLNSYYNKTQQTKIKDIERDSLIKIPERKVDFSLKPDALKPLFTAEGIAKPQTSYVQQNGLRVKMTANTDGSLQVTATADSLMFLLTKQLKVYETLIEERIRDSLIQKRSTQEKVVTKKDGTFLIRLLVGFLLACLVVALTASLVIKKYKTTRASN